MKVLILAVIYKSYDCLPDFLDSINRASKNSDAEVVVAIGDNTDSDYQKIEYSFDNISVRVFPYHENLGYLGCALRMLREICPAEQFDFTAVSNVDIALDANFFKLLPCVSEENIAWYAPDVFTPSRGTHENPFMQSRPTLKHFRKWMLMYSFPLLYGFAKRLSYMKHSRSGFCNESKDIYAGHGSFMLFSWKFIKENISMTFPGFMYAEEIFFAEMIRISGMRVKYCPELKITNVGSVSVTLLGNEWQCKVNKDSLRKLRDMYFI